MCDKTIKIKAGDVFCSSNPWGVGKAIQRIERFWAKDNKAEYGHGGIIVDGTGKTLEALWRVQHGTLDDYAGKPLLIARPIKKATGEHDRHRISEKSKRSAINVITELQLNRKYPLHRLLLHLLPPAAKIGTGNYVVCTELVGMYLNKLKILDCYLGINPDDLAEYLCRWNNFQVIFKGTYQKEMLDGKNI